MNLFAAATGGRLSASRDENDDPAPRTSGLRLGVLTLHRCINYGSFWQAQALVSGLQHLGHTAVILDHHDRQVQWREWRCALQPMLPQQSPAKDRRCYATKVRRFGESLASLPLSRPFAPGDPAPTTELDAVIVGSDEVWNPSHPWYGDFALFRGEGLSPTPLIAHAASAGGFAGPLPGHWRRNLGRFASIAVRDETTRSHVAQAVGSTPPLVLDPCLQFPLQDIQPLCRAPYVLVYGHDFPHWASASLREWAAARGLTLLSLGYRNDFAEEQWLDAGPKDFAAAVAGATAIATTMFHGCVFALNNGIPFVAMPSPYRSTKVRDLLTLLHAGHHLADDGSQVANALAEPVTAATAGRIADLRSRSDKILATALAQVIRHAVA